MLEPWIERLTVGGAGLPLPLAFTAVLEDLIDHGDSDQASLNKIIQKSMSFKEDMVTTKWGSWGAFSWDILAALKSASLIEEYGMPSPSYRVTPWWHEGDHLIVLPDPGDPGNPDKGIGLAVHGKRARVKRNVDSKALMDLKALMSDHPDMDDKAMAFLKAAVDILGEDITVRPEERHRPAFMGTHKMKAPEDQVSVLPKSRRRRFKNSMTEFFRNYVENTDQWITIKEVAEAWNAVHPEVPIIDSDHAGSMRKAARELLQLGVAETRMVVVNKGQKRTVNGVLRNINVQTAEYRRKQ